MIWFKKNTLNIRLVTYNSVSEQWRVWLDGVNVQANLSLHAINKWMQSLYLLAITYRAFFKQMISIFFLFYHKNMLW